MSRGRLLRKMRRRAKVSGYRPQVVVLENRIVPSFLPPATVPAGAYPSRVAVGDFNGDGLQDLVVTNGNGNTVSILLGNGDGTFQAPQQVAAGIYPSAVVVGDFNGDDIPDLAVANPSTPGTVSILLGNGDGTFQNAVSYAAGSYPDGLAVGDFTGNGIADLAVADHSVSGTVSVLLGNGDGTFQAPLTYADGQQPNSIVVGDFRGVGTDDIITTNEYHTCNGSTCNWLEEDVRMLRGNGDGTFQPSQVVAGIFFPVSVAAEDFNGDGHLDLVVATVTTDGSVWIVLGNGDGSFQAPVWYATQRGAAAVTVGDFNGDGIPDLAVATNYYSGGVSVLLGNGDGTFQAFQDYPTGSFDCTGVAVGDFNGDGFPDLATANHDYAGTVSVLLNAVDWDQGHPAITSKSARAARHATAPRQPSMEPVSGLAAMAPPATLTAPTFTASVRPADPTPQGSSDIWTGPPAQSEAASASGPPVTIQPATDAVLPGRPDLVDMLDLELLGPTLGSVGALVLDR
jgi:hypothetical protein